MSSVRPQGEPPQSADELHSLGRQVDAPAGPDIPSSLADAHKQLSLLPQSASDAQVATHSQLV